MSGLLVHVYRSSLGDSSNEGVTSIHSKFVLLDPSNPNIGPFVPHADTPALYLVRRSIGSSQYLHAEPEPHDTAANLLGPMFGGTFVYTSDSRFPSLYPIPVHDRWETQQQYDILSR